ncbi:hypothetical protein CK203_092641 [Vitis vinifera]|uniref:Uncharacterized protein n=1 Tax=Vitis vinifera TaxID=29760 RepID=A0A438BUT7_VITVI|nr:hypothetical protein CK203_092641 [Vitis vinifera]
MAESIVTVFLEKLTDLLPRKHFYSAEWKSRDVTYDAEDVIDRFMFEMNHQQQGSLKCLHSLSYDLFTSSSLESERSISRLRRSWLTNQGTVSKPYQLQARSNEAVPHKRRGLRLLKSTWWEFKRMQKALSKICLMERCGELWCPSWAWWLGKDYPG